MPDIFNSSKIEKIKVEKVLRYPDKKTKEKLLGKTIRLKPVLKDLGKHDSLGHTRNPLSSYSYLPDKISFVNEDPEEKVILLLRKHPVTNLGWMTVAFLMIIFPFFVTALTPISFLPGGFQFILMLVWYLITSAFILEEFLSWFFHVNIVTDERIIEVDFANLVYREITDANIDQIQDVTVEVGGALRTSLHFGNVIVQTASQVPKIEFEAVPKPDSVAKILRELRIEEEKEKLEGRVR